jgi:hypothetical protein
VADQPTLETLTLHPPLLLERHHRVDTHAHLGSTSTPTPPTAAAAAAVVGQPPPPSPPQGELLAPANLPSYLGPIGAVQPPVLQRTEMLVVVVVVVAAAAAARGPPASVGRRRPTPPHLTPRRRPPQCSPRMAPGRQVVADRRHNQSQAGLPDLIFYPTAELRHHFMFSSVHRPTEP